MAENLFINNTGALRIRNPNNRKSFCNTGDVIIYIEKNAPIDWKYKYHLKINLGLFNMT